jgi:hypothetical protein
MLFIEATPYPLNLVQNCFYAALNAKEKGLASVQLARPFE